jgi:hypothetical protein
MTDMSQIRLGVRVQFKIFNRYVKLIFVFAFECMFVLLYALMPRAVQEATHYPLSVAGFSMISVGFLFVEFFAGGKNERRHYVLSPLQMKAIVLAKDLVICSIALAMPLPMFLLGLCFFGATQHECYEAVLYLVATVPLFVLIGNFVPALLTKKESVAGVVVVLLVQSSISVVASMSFVVLYCGLHSPLLCLSVAVATALLCYYKGIPLAAKLLTNHTDRYE